MLAGKLFQMQEPATANDLSHGAVLVRGTNGYGTNEESNNKMKLRDNGYDKLGDITRADQHAY